MEPNKREIEIAEKTCRALRLSEKYNVPGFAKALADYRAELVPPAAIDATLNRIVAEGDGGA